MQTDLAIGKVPVKGLVPVLVRNPLATLGVSLVPQAEGHSIDSNGLLIALIVEVVECGRAACGGRFGGDESCNARGKRANSREAGSSCDNPVLPSGHLDARVEVVYSWSLGHVRWSGLQFLGKGHGGCIEAEYAHENHLGERGSHGS
ncbi:uncharacterized protein N7484_001788 [Penicillium longicatenatum]|uniref:uncharacterized protein n=1 Tax=Penicillium longicatenatum TaxID=1561947 RepID=UPI0025474F78|nr:uncharacterized protein N7484_001788 [Penicillium longicatenatum]KAJ5658139.1 hypothetical protein N7484_001788 [Penicillium longicatenatum]